MDVSQKCLALRDAEAARAEIPPTLLNFAPALNGWGIFRPWQRRTNVGPNEQVLGRVKATKGHVELRRIPDRDQWGSAPIDYACSDECNGQRPSLDGGRGPYSSDGR